MNSVADLKRRLLRLFPVSTLKDHFNPTTKTQAEILIELGARPDAELIQFAFANFEFTRQHVFLFEHDMPIARLGNIDLLPGTLISRHRPNEAVVENYLYDHTYTVHSSLNGQYNRLSVKFRQPIRVSFEPGVAKVCLTILERNPASYLPGYEVFSYKRQEDDKEVVNKILFEFLQGTNQMLVPMDLNAGIKALWNGNTIDARALKFKRSNSMVSEKMDENFTFKTQYPEKFAEVMAAPLKKHLFHFIDGGDGYGDFECDPSDGVLSFNKYPTKATQINHVISTIVAGNV